MKPMLAVAADPESVKFPCGATPKVDGIRALRVGSDLVSRTLKPIRNGVMRSILVELLPEGSDGELVVEGTFQDVTSAVMTAHAAYAGRFTYYWFDLVTDPRVPYEKRMADMQTYVRGHPECTEHPQARVVPLYPTRLGSREDLAAYELDALKKGFEGVMLRKLSGPYKHGRSTVREGYLLKVKRFTDDEARVVVAKAHASDPGRLGALEAVDRAGRRFSIGTGFTADQRTSLWERREELPGRLVKYKHFEVGSKHAPRFPVFLGFRHEEDT